MAGESVSRGSRDPSRFEGPRTAGLNTGAAGRPGSKQRPLWLRSSTAVGAGGLPPPGYDSGMVEARARPSAGQQPRAGSREASNPLLYCGLGLVLPGGGHLALGRRGTGVVFLVSIGLLFGFGLHMEGELFPFEAAAPLTLLAGAAEVGAGGLYVAARLLGFGAGNPEAPTYEYGYAFLIVAGLLNMLVVLDAWDIATGAKESAEEAAPADGPRDSAR